MSPLFRKSARLPAFLIFSFAVLLLGTSRVIAQDPTIATGGEHTGVIFPDGSLRLAGQNSEGQLGDGGSGASLTFKQVSTGVAAVVAAPAATFWIKSDRTLWATGDGADGALGDGGTGFRYVPVQVATSVASVSAGDNHMAFVKTDGTLWTSGNNWDGQLATGSSSQGRSTPGQVAIGVSAVAVGNYHTVFLRTNGTLWAVGQNYSGQLGDGTTQSKTAPVQIASGVASVATGSDFTLFVKTDGSLWAAGANGSGQLGDGTTSNRSMPVQVATGVARCVAGGSHSAFIKTDGSLWTMGSNYLRQLGDGTSMNRYVPVQIATGVTSVAAGELVTLWRTADAVWAAGHNWDGQFGLGHTNSPSAPVRILGLPVITVPPLSRTVNPDASVNFTATAFGPPPLTFQWKRNGGVIVGATAESYGFQVSEAHEGQYTVTVTGRDGAITSPAAELIVNDPIVINEPPQPQAVMPGQPASFNVNASGTGPITYQWRKAGSSIVGATSAMLSLTGVTAADGGNYTCTVTNVVGSTTTTAVALTVGPTITVSPQARTVNAGASTQFAVTATGSSLTYQWRRDEVPIANATSANYSFTAQKNLEGLYDVVVANAAGSVSTVPVMLSVNAAVTVTTPPAGAILQPSQPLLLEVTASGAGLLTYQWRKDGVPLASETNPTLSVPAVSVQNAGYYTCAVTNMVGTVVTAAAEVRVGPAITVQPTSRTVNPGTFVWFSVTATGSGTLSYEWRKNGVTVGNGPAFSLSEVDEEDEGVYAVVVSSIYGTVTSQSVQLQVNEKPKINKHPQSIAAPMGASINFVVEVEATGPVVYQWRHEGAPIPDATQPFLGISAVGEMHQGSYDVVVTGATGSTTSNSASFSLDRRPRITRQPQSVAGRPGASLSLSVEAEGEGELSYQWFREGVPVSGGTSPTLLLADFSEEVAGDYQVAVANAAGQVFSETAIVALSEWSALAGTYQSLFSAETDTAMPYPGRMTVTVSGRGSLSGRLELGGLAYSLAGTLSPELEFAKTFQRSGQPSLTLSLSFSINGSDPQCVAKIAEAGQSPHGNLLAHRKPFYNRENPAPQLGRYVAVLEPAVDGSSAPFAPGYALLNVTSSGAITLVGKLPDGAKLKQGGFVYGDDSFAAYQGLYRSVFPNAGFIAGPMRVSPILSDQAIHGSLHWSKPDQGSGPYAGPFSAMLPLRGMQFLPPAPGESLLEVPQGASGLVFFAADAQNESLFQQSVILSSKNSFSVSSPNSNKLTLKVDSRTGQVRGSFKLPGVRKPRVVEGVLLPGLEAVGFFMMEDLAGTWFLGEN